MSCSWYLTNLLSMSILNNHRFNKMFVFFLIHIANYFCIYTCLYNYLYIHKVLITGPVLDVYWVQLSHPIYCPEFWKKVLLEMFKNGIYLGSLSKQNALFPKTQTFLLLPTHLPHFLWENWCKPNNWLQP